MMHLTISDILTRVATNQSFNAQDRVDALNHLLGSVVPTVTPDSVTLLNNALPALKLLMLNCEKIAAIKLYRSITGNGLKVSKEFVETLVPKKETTND